MPMIFWLFAKLFFGISKPKIQILGSEFSGTVEAVGKSVTEYKPGDAVFGYLGQNMGAYSEYICLPEKGVFTRKPENMSFQEAAIVPYGAVMGLHLINKAGVTTGMKILILGASGSIGSVAVQIAKHRGAEVSGVCGTTGGLWKSVTSRA